MAQIEAKHNEVYEKRKASIDKKIEELKVVEA